MASDDSSMTCKTSSPSSGPLSPPQTLSSTGPRSPTISTPTLAPNPPKKSSFSISSILGEDKVSDDFKPTSGNDKHEDNIDDDCDKPTDDASKEAVVTSISDLYHRFQLYSDQARLGPGLASRAAGFGLWYPWYPGLITSPHSDSE